jgi:hypothetical protein
VILYRKESDTNDTARGEPRDGGLRASLFAPGILFRGQELGQFYRDWCGAACTTVDHTLCGSAWIVDGCVIASSDHAAANAAPVWQRNARLLVGVGLGHLALCLLLAARNYALNLPELCTLGF